ncbi:MAG: PEGA domain-containing protein [Bacteroidota bacterium]|nr:PEGA domain-containing protein [Bacteroidota bacterium]
MNISKKGLSVALLVLVTVVLAGCAAIFKGSSEEVELTSDPQGAKIYLNNQYVGITPTYMNLKSGRTYHFEFRKDGYKTRPVYLGNSVGAGWVILDILFGGIIGIVVDAATGSWYELDDSVVFAPLEPGSESASSTPVSRGSGMTPPVRSDDAAPPDGPTVEILMADDTRSSGKILEHGDSWLRLEVYVPSKQDFREVVLQKDQIVSVHDVINDIDVTQDYK